MNKMHMANSYDPSVAAANIDGEASELIGRRSRVLGAPYRLFYQRPVHLVRGDGALLFDKAGNDYLDAYNNVPVVGHSNPRVLARVSEQLGTLNTHTRYLTDGIVEYAERLTALFPEPLSQAVFTCTGSESVDLALRVSRQVTGRRGIIATRHAYHGTTTAAAEISPALGPNNTIPETVELVEAPDTLRETGDVAERFTDRVRAAIAAMRARGIAPAALIIDSVLSSDGLQVDPAGLLAPAAAVAREAGALVIADEVQAGFGRTGVWWGFQRHGFVPDLVVLGKPMGNGIPISAVVSEAGILESFGRNVRYFNTFGGNPVSIAAANAVLDELEDRELVSSAGALGAELKSGIAALKESDPGVAAVRGAGLFLAVEICDPADGAAPDPERAARIVGHMREHRVLISASGAGENVLKIRPPLAFESTHAPRLLEALASALRETRAAPQA